MDKKELTDKFYSLLMSVKSSGEKEDIEVSLDMFKKAVLLLSEVNLRSMKELIECYEGNLKYCNFLTESESEEILNKIVGQDGMKGPKWRDYEELFRKVKEYGGKVECEPHYNKWALYVTMNKIAVGQNTVLLKWIGDDKDKYFEACYELALTQLKDKSNPCWIRSYYGLGD